MDNLNITDELAARVAAVLLSQTELARLDTHWKRIGTQDAARYMAAAVIMSGQQSPSTTTAVSTVEVLYATPIWRALLHMAAALGDFMQVELQECAAPINALVVESVRSVHTAIDKQLQFQTINEQHSKLRSRQ